MCFHEMNMSCYLYCFIFKACNEFISILHTTDELLVLLTLLHPQWTDDEGIPNPVFYKKLLYLRHISVHLQKLTNSYVDCKFVQSLTVFNKLSAPTLLSLPSESRQVSSVAHYKTVCPCSEVLTHYTFHTTTLGLFIKKPWLLFVIPNPSPCCC